MTTILELFQGYPQFILWRAVARPDGNIDKIPCDMSGHDINAHDKPQWMTAADALARSQISGYGVGFVFTADDPFFFIDIDHCLDEITLEWSDLARQICSAFPGCATEVSYSGSALHVFGVGTPRIPFRCTRKDLGLEFYTSGRFVALTGVAMTGSTGADGQAGLDWFISTYMSRTSDPAAADWTSEPCDDWNGPTDDEELIRRAMRSGSAAAAFGGKATFKQLWEGDADALAPFFPSSSGDTYDASGADAALAAHLAFWTGRDCDRMERIHTASALGQRDKWMDREDYRQRTILGACGFCRSVYNQPQPGETPEPVEPDAPEDASGLRVGTQFLDLPGQLRHFSGCVHVVKQHQIFTDKWGLLGPDKFKSTYGGFQFALADGAKPETNAFKVFTESQIHNFPKCFGTCFRPERTPGEIITEEGKKYVNTYYPVRVDRIRGEVSPFTGLVQRLLPQATDSVVLLAYMAACVQYPGVKFQWAPLLQGIEGNGKSFLMDAIMKAIGEQYCWKPNAFDLAGNGLKFTGWLEGRLFIGIDEIFQDGKTDVQEALKDKITATRIEVQAKGSDQRMADNRANFMFLSNHKDAVRKTRADRRYCVFYSAQQDPQDIDACGMGGSYFPDLYRWAHAGGWAIIAEYLHTHPIPDEFNPAGDCHRAPETSSTREALEVSLTPIEQEIREAIEEGRHGFRGGFISSVALDRLLAETGRRVAMNKRGRYLEQLGYTRRHRMNSPSPMDGGKKPVLYVHTGGEVGMRFAGLTAIELEAGYLTTQADGITAGSPV